MPSLVDMERLAFRFDTIAGVAPQGKGIDFKCPLCGGRARNDQGMEPMCTGPHPSLDEHPPTIMRRVPA